MGVNIQRSLRSRFCRLNVAQSSCSKRGSSLAKQLVTRASRLSLSLVTVGCFMGTKNKQPLCEAEHVFVSDADVKKR